MWEVGDLLRFAWVVTSNPGVGYSRTRPERFRRSGDGLPQVHQSQRSAYQESQRSGYQAEVEPWTVISVLMVGFGPPSGTALPALEPLSQPWLLQSR